MKEEWTEKGMRAIIVFIFAAFFSECTAQYSRHCGGELIPNYMIGRSVCCSGINHFIGRNTGACCLHRAYNTATHICCGSKVFRRNDINSGCCYGKYYQRGKQQCCGGRLIDVKTHGCCRNEPFIKAYEECCDGSRVPNLFDPEHPRECCGKELYDKNKEVCCTERKAPKIAGEHTKCCLYTSYDSRIDSCCNKKTIPREPGKDKCCMGRMIDSRLQICCDFKIKDKIYGESTDCCRLGLWKYQMFDNKKRICCSRSLNKRESKFDSSKQAAERISCCNQTPYDTKHEICCGLLVRERMYSNGRCCGYREYDRSKKICCEGLLWPLRHSSEFCCGRRKYNRRQHECKLKDGKYRVVRIGFRATTTPLPKTIKIPDWLFETTPKPFILPTFFLKKTAIPAWDPFSKFPLPDLPVKSKKSIQLPSEKPEIRPWLKESNGEKEKLPWLNVKDRKPDTTINPFVIPDFLLKQSSNFSTT